MKKLLLFTLVLGFFSVRDTLAQSAPPSNIQVLFKTIGLGVTRNDIFIQQSKGYAPIVIVANGSSLDTFHYAGPAAMTLFSKVKTADKITYVPAGEVVFPAIAPNQTGNFLLLFTIRADGRIAATPVPNDSTSFPADTIRIINVLPAQAGVMVNQGTGVINPGESRLFSTASAKDDRAEIHIAIQNKGQWVEANNNVYPCEKGARRTIFLINRTPPNGPAGRLPSVGFYSFIDQLKDITPKVATNEAAL